MPRRKPRFPAGFGITQEEIGKRLGKQVTIWRKEFGWWQTDLARESGLLQTYISKLEQADTEDPGITRIMMIAAAFKRSVPDLLRAAGLIVGPRPPQDVLEDLAIVVGSLSEEGRDAVLKYAHMVQAQEAREHQPDSYGQTSTGEDTEEEKG